jgi:hypothetical protein
MSGIGDPEGPVAIGSPMCTPAVLAEICPFGIIPTDELDCVSTTKIAGGLDVDIPGSGIIPEAMAVPIAEIGVYQKHPKAGAVIVT